MFLNEGAPRGVSGGQRRTQGGINNLLVLPACVSTRCVCVVLSTFGSKLDSHLIGLKDTFKDIARQRSFRHIL